MTRLIDVLTDEERAVKARISVLEAEEEELNSRIGFTEIYIKKLDTTVKDLERQEDNLRQKVKSSKLKRFKEDKVWPQRGWEWKPHY